MTTSVARPATFWPRRWPHPAWRHRRHRPCCDIRATSLCLLRLRRHRDALLKKKRPPTNKESDKSTTRGWLRCRGTGRSASTMSPLFCGTGTSTPSSAPRAEMRSWVRPFMTCHWGMEQVLLPRCLVSVTQARRRLLRRLTPRSALGPTANQKSGALGHRRFGRSCDHNRTTITMFQNLRHWEIDHELVTWTLRDALLGMIGTNSTMSSTTCGKGVVDTLLLSLRDWRSDVLFDVSLGDASVRSATTNSTRNVPLCSTQRKWLCP